jgi:cation diffusion facilitator CzcD-associated flavoprotein CzcO
MCTGHFSKANPVSYPGQREFGKPIFNHTLLKSEGPGLANDPDVETVTVVGASKTGYDAVYYFASHGKKVHWIIRASGSGSIWMYAPWLVLGPFNILFEHLATTRFLSWFSPCIWGDFDGFTWVRKILHSTQLGVDFVQRFWAFLTRQTVADNGYRKHSSLKDLEPRSR